MRHKYFIYLFIIFMVTNGSSLTMGNMPKSESYQIIFWDDKTKEFEDILGLDLKVLLKKNSPLFILTDKYIHKYYWDEQLIEIEYDKIKEDTGDYFPMSTSIFTIVLDGSILYHGMSRFVIGAMIREYDDHNYPVIVGRRSINPNNFILALKPKFYPIGDIFRDYPAEEQQKLLNMDVYKYFKEMGKIVEGRVDLTKIFAKDEPYLNSEMKN